jgi:hypothetical protein
MSKRQLHVVISASYPPTTPETNARGEDRAECVDLLLFAFRGRKRCSLRSGSEPIAATNIASATLSWPRKV